MNHYSEYPKIRKILEKDSDSLLLTFDNNETKRFFKNSLQGKKNYVPLFSTPELFGNATILLDGLALQWTDMIDLSATYIYDNSCDASYVS